MMSFVTPTLLRNPPILPETSGVSASLYSHFAATPAGVNVFKMPDGSYLVDTQPAYLSNPDPANHANDAGTPIFTYYGAHVYQVTDAEAAALTAAGLGAGLSPAATVTAPSTTFAVPPASYGGAVTGASTTVPATRSQIGG